jgi:hypothetical protein
MSPDPRREQEEVDAAAAEAALVGGVAGDEDLDPAQRAVIEGGGGEAEGFELAEERLEDIASHGDQHRFPGRDAPEPEEGSGPAYGEPDQAIPDDG